MPAVTTVARRMCMEANERYHFFYQSKKCSVARGYAENRRRLESDYNTFLHFGRKIHSLPIKSHTIAPFNQKSKV
jgi:hypothetical protein